MSNTFREKRRNRAKRRVRQCREEIGLKGGICLSRDSENHPELLKLLDEYSNQHGIRYGFSRKYWAGKKRKRVKSERCKLKNQVREGLNEIL